VLEADLKNFFGSLNHDWVLRFVEHRVGDPRLIGLIRRWLKAGVLEDGAVHPSEQGTPQGGSISVLLSNLYLHYVLDLWFERVVKGRLRAKPIWCATSTTLWSVSNIDRTPYAYRTPCVFGWGSSASL
jgi:RNA-directed DNA polymerase